MNYFTDPVLYASTVGSMLMCLASSLIGVVVFIRKRSLLGETLSHASYPGVVLSVLFASFFFSPSSGGVALSIFVGAFIFSLLGLFTLDALERRLRVREDAAMTLVLSLFFGFGILVASRLQVTHTLWYKQIQLFLFGQAATMTDAYVVLYSFMALLTLVVLALIYYPLAVSNFDRDFAKSIGIRLKVVDTIVHLLLALSIVIGIRSVGVVLMTGILVAPAVAARQWTNRLPVLFLLAGIFGTLSGFLGNYLSLEIPKWMGIRLSLPTGPMILLSASSFAILSLLFARNRGLCNRYFRIVRFRNRCLMENVLKAMWKKESPMTYKQLSLTVHSQWLSVLLLRLRRQGWVQLDGKKRYDLTIDGKRRAARIVRLHRLWELYLVSLGQSVDKVHANAEEMEHIITPELEKELTEVLENPTHDPHNRPIPTS